MMYLYMIQFFGIWEKITSYVVEPIKSFLKTVFGSVFSLIADAVLAPVLTTVIESVVVPIIDIWWEAVMLPFINSILYQLFILLLKVLDFIEDAVDVFSGVRNVEVLNEGKMPLLDAIVYKTGLGRAMYMVTAISIFLAIFFTMLAVIRSMGDLSGKKPLSQALGSGIRAGLHFMLVPLFVKFIISLSGKLLIAVQNIIDSTAMDGTSMAGVKIGGLSNLIYFLAARDAAWKIQTGSNGNDALVIYDITGDLKEILSGSDYDSFLNLLKLNTSQVQVIPGILLVLFCVIVLCMTLFIFISRIFEVLLLYFVSPFFAATIPLDDGQSFKRWLNMFIGKIFMGFGIVIMLKLYMMVVPYILLGNITFIPGTSSSSRLKNTFFCMVFLAAGAYAVYKSTALLTTLISSEAAGTETDAQMIGAKMAGTMWEGAKAGVKMGMNALSGGFGGGSGGDSGGGSGGSSGGSSGGGGGSQAYHGQGGGMGITSSSYLGSSGGGSVGSFGGGSFGGQNSKRGGNRSLAKKFVNPSKDKKKVASDLQHARQMKRNGASVKEIGDYLKSNGFSEVDLKSSTGFAMDAGKNESEDNTFTMTDKEVKEQDKFHASLSKVDSVYESSDKDVNKNEECFKKVSDMMQNGASQDQVRKFLTGQGYKEVNLSGQKADKKGSYLKDNMKNGVPMIAMYRHVIPDQGVAPVAAGNKVQDLSAPLPAGGIGKDTPAPTAVGDIPKPAAEGDILKDTLVPTAGGDILKDTIAPAPGGDILKPSPSGDIVKDAVSTPQNTVADKEGR